MMPPKNQKQVRSFIVLLNYYKDMWDKQSYLLKPLSALTPKKLKFRWTFVEQKVFDEIKQIFTRDILFVYKDFNKKIDILTDASELQIGAVIIQTVKPIAFCSRRLTKPKERYTVTEKELLSIV